MAKQKRLNIYNSNRYFNIHLIFREDVGGMIFVNKLNEDELLASMELLHNQSMNGINKRDTNHYIIFNGDDNNDKLIKRLFEHGGTVDFYTETVVPFYVIEHLSKRLNSRAIFYIRKEFTQREIENVQLTFTACPVVIDVPVVLPDTNPYDLLFSLHDLKTNVDRVQIAFPRLKEEELSERHKQYYYKEGDYYYLKAKHKYAFFKYIQTSLSIWAMNIDIVCENQKDYDTLNTFVNKERKLRSPNAYKGDKNEKGK